MHWNEPGVSRTGKGRTMSLLGMTKVWSSSRCVLTSTQASLLSLTSAPIGMVLSSVAKSRLSLWICREN